MKLIAFLLICSLVSVFAQAQSHSNVSHVITHDRAVVVTDPGKGTNPYPSWGVFPSAAVPVRKITLHVKFECPDSVRCADWDYLDRIYIRRTGGKGGESKDFEIAKMLTPYGGAFNKDWHFEWAVDVTDFSLLLRDSVEIEYNHSGYEPNHDRGWVVTLDFEIVKGTPVAEPIRIHQIYQSDFLYGDSTKHIESMLKPVSFSTNDNADFAVLRILQTGHGMDKGTGCGEFCSKYREVYFDGALVDRRDIWKECASNPLYPQAGTWIFDRANWCPGDLLEPDRYVLDVDASSQHTVDLNMENYQVENATAVEAISAYLIEYKKPASGNDVALRDIVVPSTKAIHSRRNPSCANPVVVIRNNGSAPLREVTLKYGVGRASQEYVWRGNLAFNREQEVELPGILQDSEQKSNNFVVSLLRPNRKRDSYSADNQLSSAFSAVPTYSQQMIIHVLTNEEPQDNAWYIRNSAGKVIFENKPDSLKKNVVVRDTVKLDPGCYEFILADTAGNGLEFWYNVKGGRGVVMLLDGNGKMVQNFESDFGNEIRHSFTVSADTTFNAETIAEPSIGLFPTFTSGKTTLDYFSNEANDVIVRIVTDEGNHLVEEHKYVGLKEGILHYDLSYRPAQRYYLKVLVNDKLLYNKRIRVVNRR
ncbi:MAG TPA: peptide-N-glycosidase F-related protein [Chryseosolibacter sp.]|nr:peptide-N-glycosidase F-related protein [Chryseosolibacter sp.]